MPLPILVAYAIGAGLALAGGIFGYKNNWWSDGKKSITLSLMGTSKSGKTELYYRIKGSSRPDHLPTSVIEAKGSFNLLDGEKKIKVNKVIDYPGGKDSIRVYFDEAISEGTHYFLLFDINKVLSGNLEELGFFRFALKKLGNGKNIIFIGSFLDKVNDKNYKENVNKILKERIEGFHPENKILFGSLLDDKFILEVKKKILPV